MNITVLMIAILGHLEIDTEVLDTDMETNNCREISEDDRDANSVLAMTQERARLFYKNRQKFINLFT